MADETLDDFRARVRAWFAEHVHLTFTAFPRLPFGSQS